MKLQNSSKVLDSDDDKNRGSLFLLYVLLLFCHLVPSKLTFLIKPRM